MMTNTTAAPTRRRTLRTLRTLLAPYHGYDPRPAVVPAQRRRFVRTEVAV